MAMRLGTSTCLAKLLKLSSAIAEDGKNITTEITA
jgi:hypothetical protein